jgi:hypothetical protein
VSGLPTGHPKHLRELSAAWRQAAADLDLDVLTPFTLQTDPSPIISPAAVRNFGTKAGTVIASIDDPDRDLIRRSAEAQGLRYSFLGEKYLRYDRALFIAALDDWGWAGTQDQRPDWYSGAPDT